MKKKLLSLLLALCLVMALFSTTPMTALAEGIPSFGGGTGTQEDPWLITSQEDLIALAEFLNSGNAETFDTENAGVGNCHGYYFKQTADIDLTGVTWEPIGYSGSCYFAGNYDGGGHSITNAVSTGKVDPNGFATAGIFGWVAFGSVENLHVKNANFVATGQNNYSYVGGIAGVCYGSSIKNCSVENSFLESRRNNNNNCAGSIVGYSTGGTFEKCAAENNQVKTMCYGGGFVGEVDDTYGVGNSTFTNCYGANCTVISETDDSQGTSFSGAFAGEITDSTLTIQNCYVYQATLSTVGNAVPQGTGVFAGNLWGGSTIADTNCYYGACGITENAGTAVEKTEEDFKNSFMFSNTFASLYKKWLVYLYNTADVIITPTPYSKSLLESYDLNKEIYAISNGVDVEQFNPTSEQINEFIQKFNISVNDKLVISVGWLFERKGFDTFVEVAREMPNIKFMWFGDVKLSNPTSKIKKLLKELPENVILPGYVSGDIIKGAYGRADVFFFPSREETEGIVVLEALACKTQILLRDIPAFDPWMKDQINCYKGKTNEEFISLIQKIINKELPSTIDEGYKVAKERDLILIGQQLKEVYEKVESL